MRLTTTTLLAFTALVIAAQPAPAWNGVGHMTVAKIAYDELDKAEQQRIHKLLTNHPHYETYLKANRPDNVPVEEWAFLRAATWPDYVRPPQKPAKPDPKIVRYHRPDDHFIDMPIFGKGENAKFMEKIRKLPARHDVLCALKQRAAELRLKTAADEDRAIALCWLLHLTGDVHQPLHCGSLFTEKLLPKGDAGGNAIGFRFGKSKTPERLHTYWDGLLGVTSEREIGEIKDTAEHAEQAYKLASLKAKALAGALPRDKAEEVKARREFKDW